uniref:Uncharacterized protein n=1 Tax=Arundo donax TaxID=35708 RepID=A0A0A9DQ23_ARUDO
MSAGVSYFGSHHAVTCFACWSAAELLVAESFEVLLLLSDLRYSRVLDSLSLE